ncbi:M20/M25/M40 family metallo-hydrolase [Epilithonimonas lactis]|uniref:Leucyl aminopeptidase n=1 Tax=Epilithonimonas lactis TaxID=421072 RepID=A0A085BHN3_9FLAO|nr:M20/M25/M40 family metallo-hydrolase [Epilithonimonas lactis]KFC21978.1 leucyl aminopeptidase [Epilithonimonas lactis]SEQ50609.1 Por secretion system C-terminal sorting domain-containing protein [Epilithonimonas lactis]
MKNLLFSILFAGIFANSQTFNQNYADVSNLVSQTNVNTYLQEFEGLGVKTTGSTANNNAYNWLKNKYLSFGYSETEITRDNFTYNGNSTSNLIVTKTGTKYPNTYIIVCGHYDTITGTGTNDNGSGVSVILEVARLLKNVNTEYSIKFINFSGEEQGLLGSAHYVSNVVNATNPKMNIRLVLNIDEVGGIKGQTNDTITCERDESSNPSANNAASNTFTQQLMNCVTLYSTLKTNLSYAYASDYMPFQANGEIITGLFEYNETPYAHTANDTYANLDPVYIYKIAKATVGAVQHFAVAGQTLDTCTPKEIAMSFRFYPNPAKDYLQLEFLNSKTQRFTFTITDFEGKTLSKTENQTRIDISSLPKGIYLGTFKVEDQVITKKIIVE